MGQSERVCAITDIPLGKGREFVVQDRVVAVFHSPDGWFAVDGMCPHAGGPLAQGMVRGHVVTCPWHGWQFNLETGCHQISARIKVSCFTVTLQDDGVWVALVPPPAAPAATGNP